MTALPSRVEVLVVGAGPTGLALANLLGTRGVGTLVVERNAATSELPRAVALDDEGARTLQAAGLHDEVVAITFPAEGMRYYLEDGTCFAAVGPGVETYGYPKRLYFHQPHLERVLLAGARRHGGVHVAFSTTLTAFEQSADAVTCHVEDGTGRMQTITADYLALEQGFFLGLDDPDRLEASLVGQMIPQPRVDRDGAPACPLDTVLGSGFALIAQDVAGERALGSLAHPLWQALAPRRVSFARAPHPPPDGVARCHPVEPDLHRPFRTHRDQVLLLRPDRYVACAFAPDAADATAGSLSALLAGRLL